MVKVKVNEYGSRVVKGKIVIEIEGYLPKNDTRDEISEEEAIELLETQLDHYSGSNDGSELLANAKPKLI
jgi:hypothetical protein